MLKRAMAARTPATRARLAKAGLATRSGIDPTTQAMLLRQLYLACFETKKLKKALEYAEQAIALDVLPDVLHQDAARAALAYGDLALAVTHLRIAVKRAPGSRKPFHCWTLGSVLFLAQRYTDAIGALERASRWGTRDKPLYKAHLALARIANGETVRDLQATINQLAEAPCGQGYGRFVLGHLAYAAGEWVAARRYLEAFVKRAEAGRPALALSLAGEVRMAKATLAKMRAN